jgi:hypothetical protein
MNIFIDLINFLLDGTAEAITWIIGLLPQSPAVNWLHNKPELVVLSHITWFIPFPTMLLHFAAILTAVGAYYLYRVIARWLKVVRS